MARHTTITEAQILEAARDVFLEEGYSALTSTIAQRAGVSEGSIFKRFGTKESLFFAALQIPRRPQWHDDLTTRTSSGDPEANLAAICGSILVHVHVMLPRLITTMGTHKCSPGRDPFAGMPEPPMVRDRRILAEYLRTETAAERIYVENPELLAEMLLGMVVHQAFQLYTTRKDADEDELRSIATKMVHALWCGIDPNSNRSSVEEVL